MTKVAGSPLDARDWTTGHMAAVGRANRRVCELSPSSPRLALSHPTTIVPRTRALCFEWDRGALHLVEADEAVHRAGEVALRWLATRDCDEIVSGAEALFSRGDPNVSNYLWSSDQLFLVDWEDSGLGDPVFEVADMAEHASTRELGEPMFEELAEASGLTAAAGPRLVASRRLLACFWLAILERRRKRRAPEFQLSLEQQSQRVLDLLS